MDHNVSLCEKNQAKKEINCVWMCIHKNDYSKKSKKIFHYGETEMRPP